MVIDLHHSSTCFPPTMAVTKLIPEGAFCLDFAELFSEEKSENAGLIFLGFTDYNKEDSMVAVHETNCGSFHGNLSDF